MPEYSEADRSEIAETASTESAQNRLDRSRCNEQLQRSEKPPGQLSPSTLCSPELVSHDTELLLYSGLIFGFRRVEMFRAVIRIRHRSRAIG